MNFTPNKYFLVCLIHVLLGSKIFACVVPLCDPQLNLCPIAQSIPIQEGAVTSLDWQPSANGLLLAVGVSVSSSQGFARVYLFDGTTLTPQATINTTLPVQAVNWLDHSGVQYLAIGSSGGNNATVAVYSVPTPTTPTLVQTLNYTPLNGTGGIRSLDWNPLVFEQPVGEFSYYLAVGRQVLAGTPRVSVLRFNVTTSTLSITGQDTFGGDGYSVKWLNLSGARYLAAGLSGGPVPASRIGRYLFTPPGTLSSPPTNVPVELGSTSFGRVDWFTVGATSFLASSYGFMGTHRLKVSQFTPPTTFTNNPACTVFIPATGGIQGDIDAYQIGSTTYLTLGQINSTSNSLLIYQYTLNAGLGQYCLAYAQPRGSITTLQWVNLAGQSFLAIGGANLAPEDCYDQNVRIYALNVTLDAPIINQPINGATICTGSVIVSGIAVNGGCGILEVSIDGGAFQSLVNPIAQDGSFNTLLPNLSPGQHTLSFRVSRCNQLSPVTNVNVNVLVVPPFASLIFQLYG